MTYTNPIHFSSCPDPFVLKHAGAYWCYVTGIEPDGRSFGVRHSRDLVHWTDLGGALERVPAGALAVPDTCYWAPEVTYDNGRFYMYYSVGNEEHMQIRVAVAMHPAGPFVDRGLRLTQEPFAIDAHVFVDDDGARYLFYATDDLEHDRVGTGTAMDRLIDWFTLAGEPRPVTRAKFDWQIYDPRRESKGGARWHTLEGPSVIKRGGRYYQFFSGGNWQNDTYGVAYGVTADLASPREWEQPCDGDALMPLLRSRPQEGVYGPGHNSIVRGPDNREQFVVYHRWDLAAQQRVLAIDRLEWVDGAPVVRGPTSTPQPDPAAPLIAGFSAFESEGHGVSVTADRLTLSPDSDDCVARLALPTDRARVEVSAQGLGANPVGEIGMQLCRGAAVLADLRLTSDAQSTILRVNGELERFLPVGFDVGVLHLLRLDYQDEHLEWMVDSPATQVTMALHDRPTHLRLLARGARVALVGFALTA